MSESNHFGTSMQENPESSFISIFCAASFHLVSSSSVQQSPRVGGCENSNADQVRITRGENCNGNSLNGIVAPGIGNLGSNPFDFNDKASSLICSVQ